MLLGLLLCAFFLDLVPANGSLPEGLQEMIASIDSLRKSGQGDSAVVVMSVAINDARRRGDPASERELLVSQGQLFHRLGRVREAEALLAEAIAICEAAADTAALFEALCVYATTLEDRGNAQGAAAAVDRARLAARAAGMPGREGAAMTLLARRLLREGDIDQAQSLLEESLPLLRAGGRKNAAASSLNLLAICAGRKGDEQASRRWLRTCIEECRRIDLPRIEASALNNLGNSEMRVGDPGLAVEYFRRARDLKSEIGDVRGAVTPACNLALAMEELGRVDKAREIYETQLSVARTQGYGDFEVMVLNSLAALNIDAGRHREARTQLGDALEQARGIGNVGLEVRALILLMRDLGDQGEAATALDLLQARSEDLRRRCSDEDAVHLDSVHGRVLVADGRYAEAIPLLQDIVRRPGQKATSTIQIKVLARLARCYLATGRSRDAIEALEMAATAWEEDRIRSPDPVWRESRGESGGLVYPLMASLLADNAEKGGERDAVARAFDAAQPFKARTLLERIQDPADTTTVTNAVRNDLVTLSELQTNVLRPGEVYVDVFLGPDTSVVFVVTPEEAKTVRLPGNENGFEDRLLLLRELASGLPSRNDAIMVPIIERAAESLEEDLLGDARETVRAADRIIYCPDGSLNLLPFPFALQSGQGETDIVRVPSATFLASIRHTSRPNRADRPRVLALTGRQRESGVALPGAVKEVRSLERHYSEIETVLEDEEDSRSIGDRLAPFDVLHLSGHAQVDDQRPWRSGLLLRPGAEEPYLRASAIARLRLSARMTMLSSCESAGGRVLGGEGVQGLTSAFLCAGVPTVVAALWPVDDGATERFVSVFYEELAAGRNVGAALGRAQSRLRAQSRYEHPFFWAGFVVVGEGETTIPLHRTAATPSFLWILAAVTGLALGGRWLLRFPRTS